MVEEKKCTTHQSANVVKVSLAQGKTRINYQIIFNSLNVFDSKYLVTVDDLLLRIRMRN